jgi:hypothetical protein
MTPQLIYIIVVAVVHVVVGFAIFKFADKKDCAPLAVVGGLLVLGSALVLFFVYIGFLIIGFNYFAV